MIERAALPTVSPLDATDHLLRSRRIQLERTICMTDPVSGRQSMLGVALLHEGLTFQPCLSLSTTSFKGTASYPGSSSTDFTLFGQILSGLTDFHAQPYTRAAGRADGSVSSDFVASGLPVMRHQVRGRFKAKQMPPLREPDFSLCLISMSYHGWRIMNGGHERVRWRLDVLP